MKYFTPLGVKTNTATAIICNVWAILVAVRAVVNPNCPLAFALLSHLSSETTLPYANGYYEFIGE
jgi:hypothetical protein